MTTYASRNFQSKAAFKKAVAAGDRIQLYQAGLGPDPYDGVFYVSGPHYPAPHKWYAEVLVKDRVVVRVK